MHIAHCPGVLRSIINSLKVTIIIRRILSKQASNV